ncbi:MAG TPA: hypothetical protein VF209_03300 [Patescibacteria group bacterium]
MTFQLLMLSVFLALNVGIFFRALQLTKKGGFYTDTPLLGLLGIFVWGDALVLAPFWAVVSLIGIWLPPLYMLRFLLLFYAIRSAYEVIYWINHQVAQREYMPPFARRFSWLKPNEGAILYQLMNMVQVILSLAALGWTYA